MHAAGKFAKRSLTLQNARCCHRVYLVDYVFFASVYDKLRWFTLTLMSVFRLLLLYLVGPDYTLFQPIMKQAFCCC